MYVVMPPHCSSLSLIARFLGPTWGPSGTNRSQVGPMLAPWTLLSGMLVRIVQLALTSKTVIWSDMTGLLIAQTYWDKHLSQNSISRVLCYAENTSHIVSWLWNLWLWNYYKQLSWTMKYFCGMKTFCSRFKHDYGLTSILGPKIQLPA